MFAYYFVLWEWDLFSNYHVPWMYQVQLSVHYDISQTFECLGGKCDWMNVEENSLTGSVTIYVFVGILWLF